MNKTLYATSKEKEDNTTWIFNYYLTESHQEGKDHIGIMITSNCNGKYYENSIYGIFPYICDAKKLLKFLYDNHASPISMPYLAAEYIENNFLSKGLTAIDLIDIIE